MKKIIAMLVACMLIVGLFAGCGPTAPSTNNGPEKITLTVWGPSEDQVEGNNYLQTICAKFGGGPVGLSTIAVSVGEEPDTIEEAYEPFLIMEGYLDRTPKGRVATKLAWERLGLSPVSGGLTQPSLFGQGV